MKISLKNSALWIICIGLTMLTLAACHDENDSPTVQLQNDQIAERQNPTIDSLLVKSALKTYIFPSNGSAFSNALISRMTNTTTTFDSSVKTVIMNDNFDKLTNDDITKIINFIVSGGNLVYCNPTKEKFTSFCFILALAIDEMRKAGDFPFNASAGATAAFNRLGSFVDGSSGTPSIFDDATKTGNADFCEAVAFRGDSFHITTKLNTNQADSVFVTRENKPDSVVVTKSASASPYQFGLFADNLAEWLNEQPNASAQNAQLMTFGKKLLSSGASSELDKIALCQQVTFNCPAYFNNQQDPISITYRIWSVYATERKADYYLINQEITAENSCLQCGPTDELSWYKPGYHDKDFYYGPYMQSMTSKNKIDASDAKLWSVTPNNSTTSGSEYSEGFDFSINAGISAGETPSASLGTGLTFTTSTTRHIPDLAMVLTRNTNQPEWDYTAQNTPQAKAIFHIYHTFASPILMNDCTVSHSWIYEVPNASGAYTLTTDFTFWLQDLEMTNYASFFYTSDHYSNHTTYHLTVALNPPPRAIQNWKMYCENATDKLNAFLSDNFSDLWKPNFTLYTSTASDRSSIDNYIAEFMKRMECNTDVWKSNNFTNSYTFCWKLNDDKNIYRKETLKVIK
jgi:hypothetical protein